MYECDVCYIGPTTQIIRHAYHHHHVMPQARISMILSRHFSLSLIAFGRSSGLHPVPSQSCCMYVRAGRSAFAWPYAGVNRSTSLMSSSLLLQQCPACLAPCEYPHKYFWLYCNAEQSKLIFPHCSSPIGQSGFLKRIEAQDIYHPYEFSYG